MLPPSTLYRGIEVLIAFLSLTVAVAETNNEWSFNVLADWSYSEEFATDPGRESAYWDEKYDLIRYMYETYEGDLIVIPGDTSGGHWDTEDFAENFKPELTVQERVLEAAQNCHGTTKEMFLQAGYDTVLMAIGDHEYGGNRWSEDSDKVASLAQFRQGFTEGFNRMPTTKEYIFTEPIGKEPCRPVGTDFEDTSYAYQHKNVLFITVDTFFRKPMNYIDREKGFGGEGVLTCRVEGKHLEWFENILKEARIIDTIKHIMVQTHVPIIQPVRKTDCSGQFMDGGEESEFWKLMVKYNVDIYFAGEVHTNTVTKDPSPSSNLLQIVSRGNIMNNFLTVDVTDSTLNITAYNEIGQKATHNMEYEIFGNLFLEKIMESSIGNVSSPNTSTEIYSSGVLELLDRTSALIYLPFDEKVLLQDRQVLGMNDHNVDAPLINESINIRGKNCTKAFHNNGSFGQQYDAQVHRISLYKPAVRGAYYAKFYGNSRLGFYAMGPHAAGGIISSAFWFKTMKEEEMILVHYGDYFGVNVYFTKDCYTLTLNNGTPMLYSSPNSFVKPRDEYNLNDGQWHHVAVSMPKISCRLSEINMHINGKAVKTITPEQDRNLFFVTSGKMSIGGFGYSSVGFEKVYPNFKPFIGGIDEFYLWSKPLKYKDLNLAMRRNFKITLDTRCKRKGVPRKFVTVKWKAECENKCRRKIDCWGFQKWTTTKNTEKCIHFGKRPTGYIGEQQNASCGIAA